MAMINSHMLSIPASSAYQNHDLINEQFKQRGADMPKLPATLANDIKAGVEGSIFGLSNRERLPETLKDPTHFDEFVSGISQMVADLPFYFMGTVAGTAAGTVAGSEVPGVGNVVGGGVGGTVGMFVVPTAIRKSLVLGIQKGDIKSFPDLMERTLSSIYAGMKEAPAGVAAYMSGGATLGLSKALGPAAPMVERMLKIGQQGAAIEVVSKASEGKMPTADGFAINTALMVAMHVTMGSIDKASSIVPKVHDRILSEYGKNGSNPDAITSEALTRAQESPTEDVIDRINSISRDANPVEEADTKSKETTKEASKEESVIPDLPPASLRPAIREADGTVHIGGEGEYHPDIVERTGKDEERGFVDRKDQFHTRDEAKARLHEEEPEVYEHWAREAGGPEEEFHTTDYNEALRKSTGVKNAAVDVQRAQRELAPLESDAPTNRADVYGQARADVDAGKVDPLQIAESVNKSPRGISDLETDALNYYNAQLSNQHADTMTAVEKARGDDDPIAEGKARERLQDIERKQDIVESAVRKAGTQSGRAMRARQDMIKADYSLDKVLQRARIASKDGELSPEVRDQLETLVRQFKESNDRLDAYMAKQEANQGQQAVDQMKQEVARTERKTARKEDRVVLDKEFAGLVKQFDELVMGRMSANPFLDPEVLGLVGKMGLNRVKSGLTRIEDIVDYVHEQFTNIGHEFSKREIRDAISGYGKTANMSKDAIKVAMREAKRQGKLISALEDAKEALLPLKSGLQRDAASDRVRELQKQVKQAMRESGIDVQPTRTPAQQWKSALDSVKTRLHNQISDLTKQLQTGEKTPKREGIAYDEEAKILRTERDSLRSKLQAIEGKPGMSPEQKLKMVMASTEKSIAEYERRIKENDLTPQQRRAGMPETPELKALRERRDSLVEGLRQIKEAAKPKKAPEEAALDRYKKQLTNRIDDMERQLKTGDFSKEPRKPMVLDKEATDLKVKAERDRRKVDEAVTKQKMEARSTTEKVVDKATKWRRAWLLTGYKTLGKLTRAAMDRMGITPIEELLGGVLSQIPGVDKISDRASMHGGGLNISAEVKAVSQLWDKATAKDMWDELTTGHDSLDELFGGRTPLPPEVSGLFGQLHGALKVPEKRAEFFRRFEIGMEFVKNKNLDVGDPRVQSAVGLRSYLEAERAILMQPNFATDGYKVLLAYLHNQGILGRTTEAAARFVFPMVRVATNLPGEVAAYSPIGLGAEVVQVFRILADKDKMGKSAFDNLSMHDFDNIMRGLKKGSVGLGLYAVGLAFRKNISGYYLTEQEKKQGIKRGIAKIGGVTFPAYLQATPPLISIQLAATVGHVWDHYRMKGMSGGLVAGSAQAAAELAKEVPFYGQLARGADATQSPERTMVGLGDFAGSLIVPSLVRQIAETRDKAQGRQAKTFGEAIKLQIPGLRETVPVRGNRPRFKKGPQ
jgi:hypothetical protein